MTYKFIFTIIFGLITLTSVYSQTNNSIEQKLTPVELQSDYSQWRNFVQKRHPLLYMYNSKEYLDNYFDSVYKSLNTPISSDEFFQIIARSCSQIKDGHNKIRPSFKQINELKTTKEFLPIRFYYINDSLVVRKNYSSNDSLKNGDNILSINGISSTEIVHKILSCIQREGNNIQLALAILNYDFDIYYHFIYGYSSKYKIEYEDKNLKKYTCNVSGCELSNLKQYKSDKKNEVLTKDGKLLSLLLIDSLSTAILDIKSFEKNYYKKYGQKNYKRIISNYINKINQSNIENLVIDLRFNGGGNPLVVTKILKHLFSKSFYNAIECRTTNNHSEIDYLKRTRHTIEFTGVGKSHASKNNFKGKIYVLVNGATFSGGVAFSSILQKNKRAIFIGSETGGNPVIMGGSNWKKPTFTLKYSKIEITTATTSCILNDLNKNTGKGLIPDYKIGYSKSDILQNIDNDLNFTLDLIRKSNYR